MAGVEFDGFAEAIAAFEDMKTSTAKGVVRRVLIAAAAPFDASWRGKVHRLTGHLEESGGVGTKLSARQAALQRADGDFDVEVYAGPGPDPAAVQSEFGNSHQAPNPAVRQAWDETQDQVQQNIADGLVPEIEKTATRVAARIAAKQARLAAAGG